MIDDREGMLRSTADGVDTIKRFMLRDSNFVSHLSGAFLATQMVRDLILIGAVPVRVDYIDGGGPYRLKGIGSSKQTEP